MLRSFYLLLASVFALTAGAAETVPPNVLLIMADDVGVEAFGCYGGTSYQTPNVDRMAADGLRFTHAFAQPLCTPTRVQLMTGKYNHRNWQAFGILDPNETTFGHRMKSAGYATGIFGKWQLQSYDPPDFPGAKERRGSGMHPKDAGFDRYALFHSLETADKGSRYANPTMLEGTAGDVGELKTYDGRYGPDVWCDQVLQFFDDTRGRPTFVYYPMTLPHHPFQPTPDSPQWDPATNANVNDVAFAGDMIEYTDTIVGRLIDGLKQRDLDRDTIVIFYADNGTHQSVTSTMNDGRDVAGGKGLTTQTGIHVPLVVYAPGRVQPGVTDRIVDASDFVPTLLDIATASPAGKIDGISFADQWTDSPTKNDREAAFFFYDPRPGWDKETFDREIFAVDRGHKLFHDGRLFRLSDRPTEEIAVDESAMTADDHDAKSRLSKFIESTIGDQPLPSLVNAFGEPIDAASKSGTPPNVVILLADDLGFSDLGCYGGEIETPNLDAMADAGVRFTQFYNTARCWPTRASLMTGYYAQQVRRDAMPGVRGGGQGDRPDWATLLPEKLKAAGYRNHHSGKWHIDGEPTREGFDHSYYLRDLGRLFSPKVHTLDEQKLAPEKPDGDYYATDAIADRAVEFLKQHQRDHSGEPFLSFIAFSAPHFPLQAPADAIAKYRGRYDAGWDALRTARFAAMQSMFHLPTTLSALEPDVGPPYHFDNVAKTFGDLEVNRELGWKSLTDRQREFQSMKMEIHAAMVDVMDAAIGRILNQINTMGVADNTIVMFLSDNGASAELMVRGDGHDVTAPNGSAATHLCLGPGFSSASNTPFRRHKTWVHEGGTATPLVVRWPAGIPDGGSLRHQVGHVIDVVPTILDAAGLPIVAAAGAPPMPGRNLLSSLTSDAPVDRESLWWLHDGHRAVRVGDWKLVAAKEEPWELYDLSVDRAETNDLAGKFPERVAEMAAIWAAESDGIANQLQRKQKRSK